MTGKQQYPAPHRTATVGMLLFLASLTMLFLASMVGYFLIRRQADLPRGTLHFSPLLWISTIAIVASSFTIAQALSAVKREKQQKFRFYILCTMALAAVFVVVQTPALASLLAVHWQSLQGGNRLYGIVFCLILLHALHVLGGIAGLMNVVARAYRDRYDHESYVGVQNVAWYWHFLDIVWLVMFGTMWIMG